MKEISFIKDKRKYLHGVVLAFAALAAGLFLYFYFFYHGTADGTVMVKDIFFPLTAVTVAVALIVCPTGVGAL